MASLVFKRRSGSSVLVTRDGSSPTTSQWMSDGCLLGESYKPDPALFTEYTAPSPETGFPVAT